jgi:hypothetical protein
MSDRACLSGTRFRGTVWPAIHQSRMYPAVQPPSTGSTIPVT